MEKLEYTEPTLEVVCFEGATSILVASLPLDPDEVSIDTSFPPEDPDGY